VANRANTSVVTVAEPPQDVATIHSGDRYYPAPQSPIRAIPGSQGSGKKINEAGEGLNGFAGRKIRGRYWRV
jgi:hypothetical protein